MLYNQAFYSPLFKTKARITVKRIKNIVGHKSIKVFIDEFNNLKKT